MAHPEQREFCLSVRDRFPEYFHSTQTPIRALDIGSLDINGNNRHLFSQGVQYTGVDVSQGPNVDLVSLAHELDFPACHFDVIVSTECFEHDMHFPETFKNAIRMLRSGGLFFWTAGGTGRGEHGTLRTDGGFSSPLTSKIPGWENYYRNVDEEWIASFIDVSSVFRTYEFSFLDITKDIRFWGIKK